MGIPALKETPLSRRSVVVAQQAAEALPTLHCAGVPADLGARVDQAIAKALVIAFRVVMLQELAEWNSSIKTEMPGDRHLFRSEGQKSTWPLFFPPSHHDRGRHRVEGRGLPLSAAVR
jgi:hypothetical protein